LGEVPPDGPILADRENEKQIGCGEIDSVIFPRPGRKTGACRLDVLILNACRRKRVFTFFMRYQIYNNK
jgi:hypothetical protein